MLLFLRSVMDWIIKSPTASLKLLVSLWRAEAHSILFYLKGGPELPCEPTFVPYPEGLHLLRWKLWKSYET